MMMEPPAVYALDRLPIPSPDFAPLQERARTSLGTALHYRQIDVRDVAGLNKVVAAIADEHGRLDGLIAAAGIQQETPALEYSAEDANRMFEVNVTGAFMTAQAAAKQMIRFDNGGSIVMIASMSGTVANRVSAIPPPPSSSSSSPAILLTRILPGPHLPRLQRQQGRRHPAGAQPRLRVGHVRHPRQHHLARLHRHRHGRGAVQAVPRAPDGLADAKHAGQAERARGVPRRRRVPDQRCEQLHDGRGSEDGWRACGVVSWQGKERRGKEE